MRKLVLVTLSAALAGSATLVACSGPEPQAGTTQSTTAAAQPAEPAVHQAVTLTPEQQEGQVVFESVCWTCHGTAGHGNGPARTEEITPPSFQTQEYATASPAILQARFRASLEGADPNHPHMQYVIKLVKPEAFEAALAYIPALAYPPEIPGSAVAGQRLFQFRCAGCHGASGRGDGPGAANLVDAVKPADFTTDTLVASRDWNAVHDKIAAGGQHIHGSVMPAWDVVLPDADIWDLVAYLATFQPGLVAKPSWEN
jgi:mono/diheme cytochrome c family protein